MSTFAGISGALSSLIAQRQALDVAGQNIANANTAGYTRQRVGMEATSPASVTSLFSTSASSAGGVSVTGVDRVADGFLDARLRTQTSYASNASAYADSLSRLETVVKEPTDTGVATGLQAFWSAWEDVANSPDSAAVRSVLLGKAEAVTTQIADTYRQFEAQWDQARSDVDGLVSRVNSAADAIAELNQQIRGITVSGGGANELMDQRDQLITELSGLVGATARPQEDGTITVMVAGNPLVQSDRATPLQAQGSYVMTAGLAEPAGADTVRLSWADGTALVLTGGELAGTVSSLQPTSLGGTISRAVDAVNGLATQLASSVDALHTTGATRAPAPQDTGVSFFSFTPGAPPAAGLSVAITDPDLVAAGNPGSGALDGSLADAISQLSQDATGPDATWRAFVSELGVTTQSAMRRSAVAESTRATAEQQQVASASVDIDEEVANMMAYQTAYEGAARVMTAIDEMLDTLINRTGIVGR